MTSATPSHSLRAEALQAAGWLGPWAAVAALAAWSGFPNGLLLALAGVGIAAGAVGRRPGSVAWAVGLALLILATAAGFWAQRQTSLILADWAGYWSAREEMVGDLLSRRLQARLEAGEAAADSLAGLPSQPPVDVTSMEALRRNHGLSALALYDPQGRLIVWSGTHRGRVPEEVQRGLRRYFYRDLPLFGYMYVTATSPGGNTAVSAVLLRTDLPPSLGAELGDFASSFRRSVGEDIRVVPDAPAGSGGVWDLELPNRRLLSVVLEPPDPDARAAEELLRWRLVVGGLLLLGWVLLAAGGPVRLAAGATAAGVLVLLAGTLPFAAVPSLAPFFDVDLFMLPGPVPVSLGRFALLVAAGIVVISVLPTPPIRLRPWAAGAAIAALFPLLLDWVEAGAAPAALAGGRLEWIVYQCAVALLLLLLAGKVLVLTPEAAPDQVRPRMRWLSLSAVALALLLGASHAWFVWRWGADPAWWPSLWGLPVLIASVAMVHWTGWRRALVAWSAAGVIAGTAAAPAAWADRVEARMWVGATRLAEIVAPRDPELERALQRLAFTADSLAAEGKDGVDLLYGAWRGSGLDRALRPLWLTLWSAGGVPEDELRVGTSADRTPLVTQVMSGEHRPGDVEIFRYAREDARYVLRLDLSEGRVLTAVVPPFSETLTRSPLAPLMGLGGADEEDPLSVIPLVPGDSPPSPQLTWNRTQSGFQAELPLDFADAPHHVHYAVELPRPPLAGARATLLLVLNLVLFSVLWVAGRALLGDPLPPEARLSALVISFRARVTLALFAFFLMANALFGTIAYRSLGSASRRAAEVLAERLAAGAADRYLEVAGQMEALARQVGTELIEYRAGELREGSVEELVELGLYEGWTPYEVHRLLETGEGASALVGSSLGRWRYETAYRRLPDGDVLAIQVPLQAGATAIRTTDLVEVMAFGVLVGALLSFALALLVGRALTRPIHALQVASERVGAGNLQLRLPTTRADEFGAVFDAFNRMVRRVRRSRRQLLRTSRRTQAIMDEAAVGMMALDAAGRVLLVNPRAEALLDSPVSVGARIPAVGGLGRNLAWWVASYLESDADERVGELLANERRYRVRARTLGTGETRGGVVVTLEDVTDELRTERVLAWGEMARQVAHEVKNPLTPIKLSIQHIRRAWQDRRADFDDILMRNADAMLLEIDRLAGIAEGFSRFGAPEDGQADPLSPVDLADVVDEVLALYGGSESPIRFERRIPEGLPRVASRPHELKEVLVNLLENARAALGVQGEVIVSAEAGPRGSVTVRVSDDGEGIPPDLLPRIFEPRFSTRSKGTGLGLAIVKRLVESWQGGVSVESTPGEGTSVAVRFAVWGGSPRG